MHLSAAFILALCIVGWHVYLGVIIFTLRHKVKKHVARPPLEAHGCYEPTD